MKKLVLSRQLLYNLVDIVWNDVTESSAVPATDHARNLIKKAIERTRLEKYKSPLLSEISYLKKNQIRKP